MRWSDVNILDFIGTGLKCLKIEPSFWWVSVSTQSEWKAAFGKAFQKIGSLTGLTRLELHEFRCCTAVADTRPLHGLHLRELALHYCSDLQSDLFAPGALLLLTSLHIRESWEEREAIKDENGHVQKLTECGRIVLDLPHLVEVSGSSMLFSIGMADELRFWQKSNYTKGLKTSFERNIFAQAHGLKVWRRPWLRGGWVVAQVANWPG